jgi:phosphoribosyl 1,2-cyclic phosphodiesterase
VISPSLQGVRLGLIQARLILVFFLIEIVNYFKYHRGGTQKNKCFLGMGNTYDKGMVMRVCVLGSSSSGNATIIWTNKTKILIDCGFSARELSRRLESIGIEPESIDGILLSHEHTDHTKGVDVFSRKYKIPVFANSTTFSAARNLGRVEKKIPYNSHSEFKIKDLRITPLVVPHDASEPNAFIIKNKKKKITMATDLGTPTPLFFMHADNSDLIILESNYDKNMLFSGLYPPYLKKRIHSDFGHLSNGVSARTLKQVIGKSTKHVLLAHLSENNNTPDLALKTANKHLNGFKNLSVQLTYPHKCTKIITV